MDDRPAEWAKLLSNWINSPLSCTTSQLHSPYFSLLNGCLSTLLGSIKLDLYKRHVSPVKTESACEADGASPPPSKKPRLTETCPYSISSFDLFLRLDDGTQIPANREAVAGSAGTDGVGSEYFRALLTGGFQEAQVNAGEVINIKDVSTGMLLPVLHYLHGCRLTKDTEMSTEGRGQCQVLETLVIKGLGFSQMEPEKLSIEDLAFQKTPLGEVMTGACRFMVTELQRELEDLCVSLLQTCSFKPASRTVSVRTDDNAASKMDQDCLESAEENLANRTSELELTGLEAQTENPQGQTKKPKSSLQKTSRQVHTCSNPKTIRSVTRDQLSLRSSAQLLKAAAQNSRSPAGAGAGGGVLSALTQVYWFSQQYSYPAVGRACLSLLLGWQDCPRPSLSSSLVTDFLRRVAGEADCAETLKRDILSLVTAALI